MPKKSPLDATPVAQFEHSLDELEQLVEKMEQGEMNLEDSLAAYERGVGLYRRCQSALEQAQLRVRLLADPDQPDTAQAFAVGKAAVRRALASRCGVIGIKRISGRPYRWRTIQLPFEKVANLERKLPPDFIAKDGFGVSDDFRAWCRPLIAGEDPPRFVDGLPDYLHLDLPLETPRLPIWEP